MDASVVVDTARIDASRETAPAEPLISHILAQAKTAEVPEHAAQDYRALVHTVPSGLQPSCRFTDADLAQMSPEQIREKLKSWARHIISNLPAPKPFSAGDAFSADQLQFLNILSQFDRTIGIATLPQVASALGWEYERFMTVSDSLFIPGYILVTSAGFSLAPIGHSALAGIVKEGEG